MNELEQKIKIIDSMIAEQRTVEFPTFPGGEVYPGHKHYMQGLINGMITVQAILKDIDPVFVSKVEIPLIPLIEMSGDHFGQIFTVGFAPSFIKDIVNTFRSLHGFHNAIAMYGHFKSHRVAVALGYDVEFTISEQQGSELQREKGVREKLDALKRGDFGVSWTGLRLTMNEYLEGADLFDTELERLLKGIGVENSEVRLNMLQQAYGVFKLRRPL